MQSSIAKTLDAVNRSITLKRSTALVQLLTKAEAVAMSLETQIAMLEARLATKASSIDLTSLSVTVRKLQDELSEIKSKLPLDTADDETAYRPGPIA